MIEQRIVLLKEKREHFVAEVQALTGAIQDCEFWLSQLAEKPMPQEELTDGQC